MATPQTQHPTGKTIKIIDNKARDCNDSCEEYEVCGDILDKDTVAKIRREQIINKKGQQEMAMVVYWV